MLFRGGGACGNRGGASASLSSFGQAAVVVVAMETSSSQNKSVLGCIVNTWGQRQDGGIEGCDLTSS